MTRKKANIIHLIFSMIFTILSSSDLENWVFYSWWTALYLTRLSSSIILKLIKPLIIHIQNCWNKLHKYSRLHWTLRPNYFSLKPPPRVHDHHWSWTKTFVNQTNFLIHSLWEPTTTFHWYRAGILRDSLMSCLLLRTLVMKELQVFLTKILIFTLEVINFPVILQTLPCIGSRH